MKDKNAVLHGNAQRFCGLELADRPRSIIYGCSFAGVQYLNSVKQGGL